MKGAAIDLGSNSFICLIFQLGSHGEIETLDDEIVLTRLSESVDRTQRISPQALERSEEAFKGFSKKFKDFGVTKVLAVATSAARDAQNQKDFLDLAAKYDIPVKILSGNQEAQMTFLGVKDYFLNKSGLIIDIGGGSTEYIWVSNGEMVQRTSLNLGVVRFSERFNSYENFALKEQEICEAITKELKSSEVLEDFKREKIQMTLAVSGTPTNIAALRVNDFDQSKIEGFQLSHQDFEDLKKTYSYLPLTERLGRYPFVPEKRADVLPVGLAILQESMKFFDLDSLQVSTKGIRHGASKVLSNPSIEFF